MDGSKIYAIILTTLVYAGMGWYLAQLILTNHRPVSHLVVELVIAACLISSYLITVYSLNGNSFKWHKKAV